MFQRIVLALDSGDAGAVATSYAISLARGGCAAVHVVHVNDYLVGTRGLTSESPAEAADVVATALSEMQAAGVRATGVTYRTSVFDVAATVADVAEGWRADVVVVGSHRRRFRLPLRRGVRERIARKTSLPILSAPPPLHVGRRQRELHGSPLGRPAGSSVKS